MYLLIIISYYYQLFVLWPPWKQLKLLFQVVKLLTDGGAKQDAHITDYMTHLITGSDPDENEIEVVKDVYEKPVVNERWVVLSVKCGKQLPYPLVLLFDNYGFYSLSSYVLIMSL